METIAIISTIILVMLVSMWQFISRPAMKRSRIRQVAIHEAGHAIVSLALGRGFKTLMIQTDDSASHGHMEAHSEHVESVQRQDQRNTIMVSLAGVIATDMMFRGNHADDGFSDNLIVQNVLAKNPVLTAGVGEHQYIQSLKSEVFHILASHRTSLNTLALALLERKTLTGAEVLELLPEFALGLVPVV